MTATTTPTAVAPRPAPIRVRPLGPGSRALLGALAQVHRLLLDAAREAEDQVLFHDASPGLAGAVSGVRHHAAQLMIDFLECHGLTMVEHDGRVYGMPADHGNALSADRIPVWSASEMTVGVSDPEPAGDQEAPEDEVA